MISTAQSIYIAEGRNSMLRNYFKLLAESNFRENKEKINQENKIGLDLIIVTTFVFLSINMVLRYTISRVLIHGITLSMNVVYFALVFLVYFLNLRKRKMDFTALIYLFQIPVLLLAMFDALYYEKFQITFIFMIILLLFPVFILDRFWRIELLIVGTSIVYAIAARSVESDEIYADDMVHLVMVAILGSCASLFFVIVRLRMIDYADHVEAMAERDPLTGLYNRSGGDRLVDTTKPCIFIYLDLDRFKEVNDTFGHEKGDHVLQEMASVLQNNFRQEDVIVRVGGDEFTIYCPGKWQYDQVDQKMQSLLEEIRSMVIVRDTENMTASVGCAFAPNGCASRDQLVNAADRAMYNAKKSGRNGYSIVIV